jgi:hypothetical protein
MELANLIGERELHYLLCFSQERRRRKMGRGRPRAPFPYVAGLPAGEAMVDAAISFSVCSCCGSGAPGGWDGARAGFGV